MREIKFRAWDSVQEVMLPVENIDFRNDLITLNEDDNSLTDTFEMITLMQYTGVKDYTGREIYEGDLYEDKENMLWQIKFIDGVFILTNVDIPAYHYVTILNKRDTFKHVGNIYENKDLLEEIE